MNELPKKVRLRVQMQGITVDVKSNGVNEQLALSLIDEMIETTKERLEGGGSE